MAFCPKCGKKGIKGVFCSDCAEDELGLSFKDVVVKKCVDCDKFMVKFQWRSFDDVDEGIVEAVRTKIKNPREIPLEVIPRHKELVNKPGVKQELEMEVSVEGQDFIIPGWIEFTYCDRCCKAGTEYFEGTLQLRNVGKDVVDYVRKDIVDNQVSVAKEIVKGKNVDMKLSSAKYLRALGKRLQQRFNGELTISSKLFTRNKMTSKEVHRVTVLFKIRDYKVGDVVESRGKNVKIKTVGKRVSGVDVDTGKKVFVE
ncbi:NMD3-related protein [Nanoarchaeota archaeon]